MDWFSKLFGPVFLTVAISMYIVIQILLRIGVLDSIINGGREWERGTPEARNRTLSFTILAVLIIMTCSLAIEGVVETIQNAL